MIIVLTRRKQDWRDGACNSCPMEFLPHSFNKVPLSLPVGTSSYTAYDEFTGNQRTSLQIHPLQQQRSYQNEKGSIKQSCGLDR